jgi:MoaA/NifB/PqqE/SkfB family radical SAM enzyme
MHIDTGDWKVIGTCNLRCLHCYGPPKTEKALPPRKLFEIIEKFKDLKIRTVVLTGGEPLLVQNIGEIMRVLYEANISIALSTNTSFFSKFQGEIGKYVTSLNIPLDGSTSEIHAKSRVDRKTFFSCLETLRYYKNKPNEKPRLLRVGTVYSKATSGDFLSIAKLLQPFMEVINTWKIYELIDYEFQQDLRQSIIHNASEFEAEMVMLLQKSDFGSKIMIAPASARDKAYFMVNPKGQVVIPTDLDGITHEIVIGDILKDSLDGLIEQWFEKINAENYHENHERHYGKIISSSKKIYRQRDLWENAN